MFIILVSLTMTCFSEKMLVSTICIHGFMSNLIKKSSTDSTGAVFIWKSKFTIGFGNLWKFWVESSCVAWEPIRLDILFPSAGAAVAHGLGMPWKKINGQNWITFTASQKIRLCVVNFEGQFQIHLQAESINFWTWKFRSIMVVFLLFFAGFVKSSAFCTQLMLFPKGWIIWVTFLRQIAIQVFQLFGIASTVCKK